MLAYVAISTEKVPPKIQGLGPSVNENYSRDGKRRPLSSSLKREYNGYSRTRPLLSNVTKYKVMLNMLLNGARKVKGKEPYWRPTQVEW